MRLSSLAMKPRCWPIIFHLCEYCCNKLLARLNSSLDILALVGKATAVENID